MSHSDVSADDMDDPGWSDAQLDALLDGVDVASAPSELSSFVVALRQAANATPAVPPSSPLASFLPSSSTVVDLRPSRDAATTSPRGRRLRLVGGAGAFLGTLGGKVILGAAMAAAAVGGAHVVEIIDVPGLLSTASTKSVESSGSPETPSGSSLTTAASDSPNPSSVRSSTIGPESSSGVAANAEGPGSRAEAAEPDPPGKKEADEIRNCEFGRERKSVNTTQPGGGAQPSHESTPKPCPTTSANADPNWSNNGQPTTSEPKTDAKSDSNGSSKNDGKSDAKSDAKSDNSRKADDGRGATRPVTDAGLDDCRVGRWVTLPNPCG